MRLLRPVLLLVAATLALAGCASATPGSAVPPSATITAPGEVVGQGTVLQKDGETAMLCLGVVAQSYPPQCTGPAIAGWDWSTIDLKESSGGVTWGTFAVFGTWDGTTFTSTQSPIPLALYDPMKHDPDPRLDPANAGAGTAEGMTHIQNDLMNSSVVTVLSTHTENGYVWVSVIYDDGTIQAYFDATYGFDVVAVQPALVDR
ncbi:MAG: hypothetical protein ABIR17_04795 [Pseudolysinimonas sp.]|uniref:hypothetical protein n=1 Tax=Pseudolysinimonas sp. TaxID=2680009 RepID=UPI00326671E5